MEVAALFAASDLEVGLCTGGSGLEGLCYMSVAEALHNFRDAGPYVIRAAKGARQPPYTFEPLAVSSSCYFKRLLRALEAIRTSRHSVDPANLHDSGCDKVSCNIPTFKPDVKVIPWFMYLYATNAVATALSRLRACSPGTSPAGKLYLIRDIVDTIETLDSRVLLPINRATRQAYTLGGFVDAILSGKHVLRLAEEADYAALTAMAPTIRRLIQNTLDSTAKTKAYEKFLVIYNWYNANRPHLVKKDPSLCDLAVTLRAICIYITPGNQSALTKNNAFRGLPLARPSTAAVPVTTEGAPPAAAAAAAERDAPPAAEPGKVPKKGGKKTKKKKEQPADIR